MAYTNELLGAIDKMCPASELAELGTALDILEADLDNITTYSGDLLSASLIAKLNSMCPAAYKVQLGTLIQGLLQGSALGSYVSVPSNTTASIINNMCPVLSKATLGTKLQTYAGQINAVAIDTGTDILTFSIENEVRDAVINSETHTVVVTMAYETNATALIPTFTLSLDASATVSATPQVSGTTPNNFTSAVTYLVTAEDEVTTQEWTVTVVVLDGAEIDAFAIASQVGTSIIDDEARTVNILMPYGTTVTALTPTFTLSTDATAVVGTTPQVSGVTANDFTSPVVYTITSGDEETVHDYTVTVRVAYGAEMETFTIDGQVGDTVINDELGTIALSVPFGTDVTALIATFTSTTNSEVVIGSTTQTSGVTANNFTDDVVYEVISEDEIESKEYTVTVTILGE
jgi:hypothetical protein